MKNPAILPRCDKRVPKPPAILQVMQQDSDIKKNNKRKTSIVKISSTSKNKLQRNIFKDDNQDDFFNSNDYDDENIDRLANTKPCISANRARLPSTIAQSTTIPQPSRCKIVHDKTLAAIPPPIKQLLIQPAITKSADLTLSSIEYLIESQKKMESNLFQVTQQLQSQQLQSQQAILALQQQQQTKGLQQAESTQSLQLATTNITNNAAATATTVDFKNFGGLLNNHNTTSFPQPMLSHNPYLQQPTMYPQFLQQSSYPITYTQQQQTLQPFRTDNSAFFAFLAHLNRP